MSDPIDWSLTTFEGNRLRQHREFMALSFREKLIRIEQLSAVAALFKRVPLARETAPDPERDG